MGGVPTAVYYPKPLHQQTAYKHFPVAGNGLPVSERAHQRWQHAGVGVLPQGLGDLAADVFFGFGVA